MFAMNLRRGFFRLTLVASLLSGIVVGLLYTDSHWYMPGARAFAIGFAIGLGACWVVYAIVRFLVIDYVIKGFRR